MDIQDFPALQELRKLAQESPLRFGHLHLDEQAFFVATTKLKMGVPEFLKSHPEIGQDGSVDTMSLLRAIDDLEALVEAGSLHFLGKVFVKADDFNARLSQCENAFSGLVLSVK